MIMLISEPEHLKSKTLVFAVSSFASDFYRHMTINTTPVLQDNLQRSCFYMSTYRFSYLTNVKFLTTIMCASTFKRQMKCSL